MQILFKNAATVIVCMAIFVMAMTVNAESSPEPDQFFYGTWTGKLDGNTLKYKFKKGHTGTYTAIVDGYSFKTKLIWNVQGEVLVLQDPEGTTNASFIYYSFDDKHKHLTLNLDDHTAVVFHK